MVAILTIPEFAPTPRPRALGLRAAPGPRVADVGAVVRRIAQRSVSLAMLAALALALLGALVLASMDPTIGDGGTYDYDPSRVVEYTVEPGDSLWSIAKTAAPGGETAAYAQRVLAANRGVSIAPGASITLPAP